MSSFAVVNPATGELLEEFPEIGAAELDAALAAADGAHRTWSRSTTAAQRAELVRRVGELHSERREELADIIVTEMGKPRDQALGEIDFCADIYSYYADNGPSLLADEAIELSGGSGSALVRYQSLGVILGIMPWNFPYYQVARFAGPNLVIGNTVLLKHAPQCPRSATALVEIYRDAGFPDGAYVNIFATNAQIEGVIADPRVQGVSLTGSERAGAAVAEIAGRNLKKVVLELGGSDPFILLSTADMDATVESAVAARLDNSGQSCNAAKRFIVIDSLYDEFLDKFTDALTAAKPADPARDGAALGPLSSATATARLGDQVDRAVASGANIVGGGHDGNFFRPAVLTGVEPGNAAYREEFFGPVASVYRATSEEDAIATANATPFGLGSYVFTTDPDQAMRVANAMDAGMVFINVVGADSAELPFGGVKRSGFGRELGKFGIGEFVNRKMIRIG
ncbi:MAG: succinate-semialdehyde dehydrogenase [Actinobacteria bacterium 69-20]|nr:NAD-dependent succinate-semialdehyde dehydrogenase [Actinomycetota bacterium]OJV25815.1 MAG: succinate-semialdehyde dehydrogenase [Actinobacteria bacterium 69-20]